MFSCKRSPSPRCQDRISGSAARRPAEPRALQTQTAITCLLVVLSSLFLSPKLVSATSVDEAEVMDQPDSPARITTCEVNLSWHSAQSKMSYQYDGKVRAKNISDQTLDSIVVIVFGVTRGGRVLFAGEAIPDGSTRPGHYSTLVTVHETGNTDNPELISRDKKLDHFVCAVARADPENDEPFIDDRVVQWYQAVGGSGD